MNPVIVMNTSLGTLKLELYAAQAPRTVANFLRYVEDHFYDGTLFHRVIPGFLIQGGGYVPGLWPKKARDAIQSESANGLFNRRGTLAMARTAAADSATCQFFINLSDNPFLDRAQAADQVGQCVFGRVVEGIEIMDWIAEVRTESRSGHFDVPVKDVLIQKIRPFVSIDPNWLIWSDGIVRRIAEKIHKDRCFEDLPILADALMEAGCNHEEILSHCRQPGEHVRGCWVVDLILGNE